MENEIWKDVKNYEKYYQVSNKGRVKSKDRKILNGFGLITKKAKILNGSDNSKGYKFIMLNNGKTKLKYYIHRLVANHFILNSNNLPEVNHKDSNPSNNNANNLEWITHKDNYWHARNKGRFDEHIEVLKKAFSISRKKQMKSVIGINLKDGSIIKYKYLNLVKNDGFQPSCVCNCCKGIRNYHKGYRWNYV